MKCSNKKWVGVVSRAHVLRGVEGGFAQVCHGKKSAISRLAKGDWLIYYSPKTHYPKGERCQLFTALGQVKTGEAYQVDMGNGFCPYRIDIDYIDFEEFLILEVKDQLEFAQEKNWGMKLRYGLFEISAHDFAVIHSRAVHLL